MTCMDLDLDLGRAIKYYSVNSMYRPDACRFRLSGVFISTSSSAGGQSTCVAFDYSFVPVNQLFTQGTICRVPICDS